MQPTKTETITSARLIDLFEKNRKFLIRNDTKILAELRGKAFESFGKLGFPDTKMETWRHTDLSESLGRNYDYYLHPMIGEDTQKVFRCNIPH
ncbi:MAG: hypothetical protein WCI71_09455, partial [Bacteroidota bacterium]